MTRRADLRLEWRAEYGSGNASLDGQHEDLFRAINEVVEAGCPLALVDELITLVMTHFRDEEDLLARLRVPGAEQHTRGHARLMARFLGLRQDLVDGHTRSVDALIEFLAKDVVEEHLLRDDRRFFPALSG